MGLSGLHGCEGSARGKSGSQLVSGNRHRGGQNASSVSVGRGILVEMEGTVFEALLFWDLDRHVLFQVLE